MTRDDIIRLAREAGWHDELLSVSFTEPLLERFAALVAAAEREACERECENWVLAKYAADAIRARGEK
jgi:hypothetical protein